LVKPFGQQGLQVREASEKGGNNDNIFEQLCNTKLNERHIVMQRRGKNWGASSRPAVWVSCWTLKERGTGGLGLFFKLFNPPSPFFSLVLPNAMQANGLRGEGCDSRVGSGPLSDQAYVTDSAKYGYVTPPLIMDPEPASAWTRIGGPPRRAETTVQIVGHSHFQVLC